MDTLERYGLSPERAWIGGLVAGVLALAAAAIAFTGRVYWGFIWQYFWGPVVADARGDSCMVHYPSTGETVRNPGSCLRADYPDAFFAEPGYTLVSEIGYMVVLLFMLAGVYMLLRDLDLEPYREFFFALVPFMLFGGALRVVEDSFVAAREAGLAPPIDLPWSALIISPFIYVTVFTFTLAALGAAKWLERSGRTETYQYPLAAIGAAGLAASVGYLTVLAFGTAYVEFHPAITVLVVGLSTALAVAVYRLADRYAPTINAGTGYVGLAVLWGHAVDGVANVIASDWTYLFGVGQYTAKHPANAVIVEVTTAIQRRLSVAIGEVVAGVGPDAIGSLIGNSWPFLLIKIGVAVAIVAIFDRQFMEDSPRYAVVLLVAITAVGLGPGTRDMIRVTFAI